MSETQHFEIFRAFFIEFVVYLIMIYLFKAQQHNSVQKYQKMTYAPMDTHVYNNMRHVAINKKLEQLEQYYGKLLGKKELKSQFDIIPNLFISQIVINRTHFFRCLFYSQCNVKISKLIQYLLIAESRQTFYFDQFQALLSVISLWETRSYDVRGAYTLTSQTHT